MDRWTLIHLVHRWSSRPRRRHKHVNSSGVAAVQRGHPRVVVRFALTHAARLRKAIKAHDCRACSNFAERAVTDATAYPTVSAVSLNHSFSGTAAWLNIGYEGRRLVSGMSANHPSARDRAPLPCPLTESGRAAIHPRQALKPSRLAAERTAGFFDRSPQSGPAANHPQHACEHPAPLLPNAVSRLKAD